MLELFWRASSAFKGGDIRTAVEMKIAAELIQQPLPYLSDALCNSRETGHTYSLLPASKHVPAQRPGQLIADGLRR